MKKLLITLLLLLGTSALFAQQTYNTIFFSENGEKFRIFLNGKLQNEEAQANVKITGLSSSAYQLQIEFEDKQLGVIKKNLILPENSAELTYRIKLNRRGKYVIRFFGEAPLPSTPEQETAYEDPSYSSEPQYERVQESSVSSAAGYETESESQANPGTNSSISMNVDGKNFRMNVQVNESADFQQSTTVHTQEVNTSTTTKSSVTASPGTTSSTDHYEMPGYNGAIGCPWPMQESDFFQAKQSISSKTFEDSKLEIAKQIVKSNCLFAHQVKEIMNLFTYEDSKLEFARFAYTRTYDTGNYFKVYDAFDFESTIEELNEHINTLQ